MKPLIATSLLVLLALLPAPDLAQDKPAPAPAPSLEELWKTGSLWQVGDNIPKVEAARKAIVAASDEGLAFAFTKLGSSDGLEYRCIEAVFKGFGAKALPGLLERMGHENVQVRRNVAAMFGVIDDKSVGPKIVEYLKKETDLRCRVGHLQALARWKEPTALDPLIECTKTTQEQEPLAERLKVRVVPLLANYEDEKAIARLIELLDDPAYFIRDAARDALRGSVAGQEKCYQEARTQIEERKCESPRRVCALLAVCSFSTRADYVVVLTRGLFQEDAGVRATTASCLTTFVKKQVAKLNLGKNDQDPKSLALKMAMRELIDLSRDGIGKALDIEDDPGALSCMEEARESLRKLRETME